MHSLSEIGEDQMEKPSLVLLIVVVVAPALAANVELIEGKDRVDVKIDGKRFTTYCWGQDVPKPVLVPIRTPSGIEVSRRHPLTELEGGSDDHLHHTGLFFAVDGVNDTKFWNNAEPLPQIRHKAIKDINSERDSATLVTTSQWIDKNGTLLLEDERTLTFRLGSGQCGYAIDYSLDMTAKVEKVLFEDTEEGVRHSSSGLP
jgi:hypothetical protein